MQGNNKENINSLFISLKGCHLDNDNYTIIGRVNQVSFKMLDKINDLIQDQNGKITSHIKAYIKLDN